MRNIIIIDNIEELGKNLKEMTLKLEEMTTDNDVYIRPLDFNINLENKNEILKTINFAVDISSMQISALRKETAKTRKKGDVGKKKALTEKQELELIEFMKDNHTRRDASDKYDISTATVTRILKKHNVSIKPGPK